MATFEYAGFTYEVSEHLRNAMAEHLGARG